MKILLANPPWRKGKFYGIRAGSRWPFMTEIEPGNKIPGYMPFPFFLAYAAAVLEKEGFEVMLKDALAEGLDEEEFMSEAVEFAPGLYAAETSTPSINIDIETARKIKERMPDVKTVLCGPHASVFPVQLMEENPHIDFIIVNEYEFALAELASGLKAGKKGEAIPGVWYRGRDGVVFGGKREQIKDINVYPWPARHHLPMLAYNDTFSGMPSPNVQVWASRGCPFKCNFCNWPSAMYGGSSYRVREVKNVIDEVEYLIKKYGFKAFYFDDDTFNIGKERILAICKEIIKRGITVPWGAMARADTSDRETLAAMKNAGLYAIKFGVESGVQEIVDTCGKGLDLSKVLTAVKTAKELGIKVHLTFTFGLPGETKETALKTMDFAVSADPDSVQFSIVTPFPGTQYYNELTASGELAPGEWEKFDGNNSNAVKRKNFREGELEKICSAAVRKWTRHQLFSRLMKHPFKTFAGGLKKPGMALVFIKNMLKGK